MIVTTLVVLALIAAGVVAACGLVIAEAGERAGIVDGGHADG